MNSIEIFERYLIRKLAEIVFGRIVEERLKVSSEKVEVAFGSWGFLAFVLPPIAHLTTDETESRFHLYYSDEGSSLRLFTREGRKRSRNLTRK